MNSQATIVSKSTPSANSTVGGFSRNALRAGARMLTVAAIAGLVTISTFGIGTAQAAAPAAANADATVRATADCGEWSGFWTWDRMNRRWFWTWIWVDCSGGWHIDQ